MQSLKMWLKHGTNISLDTIQGIYDDTFDTGYYCDSCEYKYVVDEPHGEVTRHCSQANYPEECPIVENAIDESGIL